MRHAFTLGAVILSTEIFAHFRRAERHHATPDMSYLSITLTRLFHISFMMFRRPSRFRAQLHAFARPLSLFKMAYYCHIDIDAAAISHYAMMPRHYITLFIDTQVVLRAENRGGR